MRCWPLLAVLLINGSFVVAQTKPAFIQHTVPSWSSPDAPIVVKADLNNDGTPDLVLCCDSNNNVWYQLATGTSTFFAPVLLGAAAFPGRGIAAGDFNNDGNDDVLVVDSSRRLTIYYNNGAGAFTPATYFSNANALQVAVADFNHDGNLDIAYTTNSVSPIQVFLALGDGKGGFSSPTVVYSAASDSLGWGLQVGDFDGDHNADLVFSITPCFRGGCNPSTIYVLYGTGAGSFEPSLFPNAAELNMTSADVNQDGRSDLAITTFCPEGSCETSVGALLGNSDRSFTEVVSVAPSADFNMLAVADLNGDLRNDLVDSYGINYTMGAYIALATSPSSWTKQMEVPLSNSGAANEFIVAADFNGDRKPDLAIYQAQSGMLQVLENSTQVGKYGTCAYPARGQGIHVCSPRLGGKPRSPVRFRAASNSFQPIRKTELWIDGVKITEQYRSWLDYSALLASGTHSVAIYVNNYDNDFQRTSFTITVK